MGLLDRVLDSGARWSTVAADFALTQALEEERQFGLSPIAGRLSGGDYGLPAQSGMNQKSQLPVLTH